MKVYHSTPCHRETRALERGHTRRKAKRKGQHRLDEEALDSVLDRVDLRLHLPGLGGNNAAGDHGTVEKKRSETVAEQVQQSPAHRETPQARPRATLLGRKT